MTVNALGGAYVVISRAWGFQIVAKAKSEEALGGEIMSCPTPTQ